MMFDIFKISNYIMDLTVCQYWEQKFCDGPLRQILQSDIFYSGWTRVLAAHPRSLPPSRATPLSTTSPPTPAPSSSTPTRYFERNFIIELNYRISLSDNNRLIIYLQCPFTPIRLSSSRTRMWPPSRTESYRSTEPPPMGTKIGM